MFKKWYISFVSNLSYLVWRLKKKLVRKKEEPTCEHCGGLLKYHAWSDCGDTQAALRTISEPTSENAKAFYGRMRTKVREENPDPMHGADTFSCVYRGPGGPGCGD